MRAAHGRSGCFTSRMVSSDVLGATKFSDPISPLRSMLAASSEVPFRLASPEPLYDRRPWMTGQAATYCG